MGKHATLLKGANIVITPNLPNTKQVIKRWIESAGGALQTSVVFPEDDDNDNSTTHCVASEQCWKEKSSHVSEALEKPEIHIVSYDWLHETLTTGSKKSEKQHSWRRIEKSANRGLALEQKAAEKVERAESRKRKRLEEMEEKKKKSGRIDYVQALAEHVDLFVGEEERDERALKDKLQRKKDMEAEVLKMREKEELREKRREEKTGGGEEETSKAERSTPTHHIYKDEAGYEYEINITPRATSSSPTSTDTHPLIISLYESNTSNPHTYATCTRTLQSPSTPISAASKSASKASIKDFPSTLSSTLPTALRIFKANFQECTGGVAWEERFEVFGGKNGGHRDGDGAIGEGGNEEALEESRSATDDHQIKDSLARDGRHEQSSTRIPGLAWQKMSKATGMQMQDTERKQIQQGAKVAIDAVAGGRVTNNGDDETDEDDDDGPVMAAMRKRQKTGKEDANSPRVAYPDPGKDDEEEALEDEDEEEKGTDYNSSRSDDEDDGSSSHQGQQYTHSHVNDDENGKSDEATTMIEEDKMDQDQDGIFDQIMAEVTGHDGHALAGDDYNGMNAGEE